MGMTMVLIFGAVILALTGIGLILWWVEDWRHGKWLADSPFIRKNHPDGELIEPDSIDWTEVEGGAGR
jgi:hypothetical protein